MERLFNFVYEYRAFFTFMVLEIFCCWLLIQNNQYQNTKFFNSSNKVSANVLGVSQGVKEYFSLQTTNEILATENALLRKKLEKTTQSLYVLDVRKITDTTIINRYDYVSAKVVNNSTSQLKNFITINRGSADGISAGMAVISSGGAVGKVKLVSKHFAVLISLLNTDEQVSSVIKRNGYIGTVQWDGTDSRMIDLRFIPRHVAPAVGDTILTSGYNAIFPEGIMIGVVSKVTLKEEAPFFDIKVQLVQDFGKLAFVEVVKSNLKAERDSLEFKTTGIPK